MEGNLQHRTLEEVRRQKLEAIAQVTNPYPERYETTHGIAEAAQLKDGTSGLRIAGRILSIRGMGKLTFFEVGDIFGRLQASIRRDEVGEQAYSFFQRLVDIGDFVGLEGELFTTRSGEKTLRVEGFTFLGKSLQPLPEKHHGLTDVETRYRRRYLDLIVNQDSRERFLLRSRFVRALRRFLEDDGYLEIETPVLCNSASGALARPFVAHHNALDLEVYLRIAPETYLKRAIVGGYNRVFEFARCFRNEGMDATHLQDFTMLEAYCAYYNYEDNMRLIQRMLCGAVQELYGSTRIVMGEREIEFSGTWPVVSFRQLLLRDCGIDIDEHDTAAGLLAEINRRGIALDSREDPALLGRGNLIDLLYKRVSRPRLIEPTFLVAHPTDLSPLARANDDNPDITDRFQLLINGAEIVNGYSELVDPIEQRRRLEQQAQLHAQGDAEAMQVDEDYLAAMEVGMPPISGWGMGIDRVLQVLTGQGNLRDVVLFPLMRPLE